MDQRGGGRPGPRGCAARATCTSSSHPTYGEFRLQTLQEDQPRYVAFRWIDNDAPESGTTVEFWIDERADGVTLRVSETGFASLRKDPAADREPRP